MHDRGRSVGLLGQAHTVAENTAAQFSEVQKQFAEIEKRLP